MSFCALVCVCNCTRHSRSTQFESLVEYLVEKDLELREDAGSGEENLRVIQQET